MKEEILLLPLEKRNDINQKYISLNNTEYETSNEEDEQNAKEIEDLSSNYMKLRVKYNEIVVYRI